MCIFSGTVRDVSRTRIYARMRAERQLLVYEMRVATDDDVAMILPLPTVSPEGDQVAFISLSDYPGFFAHLDLCFPKPELWSGAPVGVGPAALEVHRVGAFEASFVPSAADFVRLDSRFRLPQSVWGAFPGYSDYGFAVFQIRRGEMRVHPMALSFATREPQSLFFPTTHVHDGEVHHTAAFDHSLYAQGAAPSAQWLEGSKRPREVMDLGNFFVADPTRGIIDGSAPVVRRSLHGGLPNTDHRLSLVGEVEGRVDVTVPVPSSRK